MTVCAFRALAFFAFIIYADAVVAQAVVPTQTLRPGDIVSAEDVQISGTGMQGYYTDISQVLGLEAQRVLYKGRPIQEGDVGPPALVERNEIVTLIYQTGVLSIAAEGRSLDRGAAGDWLKVLNLVSRNTVEGRVNEAGEVIVGRE